MKQAHAMERLLHHAHPPTRDNCVFDDHFNAKFSNNSLELSVKYFPFVYLLTTLVFQPLIFPALR